MLVAEVATDAKFVPNLPGKSTFVAAILVLSDTLLGLDGKVMTVDGNLTVFADARELHSTDGTQIRGNLLQTCVQAKSRVFGANRHTIS